MINEAKPTTKTPIGLGDKREDWDVYYARIARAVASRSTCPRRDVGAVLVKDKYLKGTGYNGAPADTEDCLEHGCLMRAGHCVRTVHAEANIILQSDYHDRQGATLYTTDLPCYECCKLIVNSGVSRIVFERDYKKHRGYDEDLCAQAGVKLEKIEVPGMPIEEINDLVDVPAVEFVEGKNPVR